MICLNLCSLKYNGEGFFGHFHGRREPFVQRRGVRQHDSAGTPAANAPNLRVLRVADNNDLPPFFGFLTNDLMDALDQRTGRVNHSGAAIFQLGIYRAGNAVGTDNDPLPLRQLRNLLDDRKPFFLQRGHGVAVVDQLTETPARAGSKRFLRHADRPLYAEAESRAAGQNILCCHALIPPA